MTQDRRWNLRLIEEVRKRPVLWDYQKIVVHRKAEIWNVLWTEIGQILNADVKTCKRTWTSLRSRFCTEMCRISNRILKAKQEKIYDPNKKYYCWAYFDAISFVGDGLTDKARYFRKSRNILDTATYDNNNKQQIHSVDSNTSQTESDNDVEIVEPYNSNQMQTATQNDFENQDDSSNDVQIVENDNLDQSQYPQENYFEDEFQLQESDNACSSIPVDDFEVADFKSYTVSCVQDSEFDTFLNDNDVLQRNHVTNVEPELQIKAENNPIENVVVNKLQVGSSSKISAPEVNNCYKNFNTLKRSKGDEHNDLEEFVPSPPAANSTSTKEHTSSLPDLNDEDYSFLYSFLSQTKIMTQSQKTEFRVSVQKLLAHTFPACSSVNILEKQLLLPEDRDPDRKFLISLWPFIKLMSLTQNSQFRAKMAALVLQILSSQTAL